MNVISHIGDERWHDLQAHRELVRRISLAPSREWINGYFDLTKRIVDSAGFAPNDTRLSLTMPEARQKSPAIRVNVNNRWVLVNYTGDKGYRLGIIYGSEYEYQPHLWDYIEYQWRFEPLLIEQRLMSPTPYFLWLRPGSDSLLPKEMEPGWLDVVLATAHQARNSVYRIHHQPVVYRAATELAYRKQVLDEAFRLRRD